MYLISARFRPSRSKKKPDKAGVVFYRITELTADGGERRPERNVNSLIHGHDESILLTERAKIIDNLRLLYCVIERLKASASTFSIDDVANDFRKALAGDIGMTDVIVRSKTNFPLRKDVVSVSREFKSEFSFICLPSCKVNNRHSMSDYIFNRAQMLKNEHRVSHARSYLSILSSLRDYVGVKELMFSALDQDFIHSYAKWLKLSGISESTQSFYLRTLRAIINQANRDGLIDYCSEWFRDINTGIDHSLINTFNKALDRDTLLKIENVDLPDSGSLALIRDMFMFGFYCGGMELVDIANLTKDNITGGRLIYRRRLKGQEKKIVLGTQARRIITRYSRTDGSRHLFPLLDKAGNVMFGTVRNHVFQSIKTIGRSIGRPDLTFSMNIGTYRKLSSEINVAEILLQNSTAI